MAKHDQWTTEETIRRWMVAEAFRIARHRNRQLREIRRSMASQGNSIEIDEAEIIAADLGYKKNTRSWMRAVGFLVRKPEHEISRIYWKRRIAEIEAQSEEEARRDAAQTELGVDIDAIIAEASRDLDKT
ncbi:hypothetical protein [Ruegeria atlantica]|uniref:hypothetical protein n=1 Tax=Ruegeria atlantica TaxID=81569 RepID=UPI001481BEEB|nr:hypothetical protein [Ruegeria atlantica]